MAVEDELPYNIDDAAFDRNLFERHTMTAFRILTLVTLLAGGSTPIAVHQAVADGPKPVVELFTSQGCSSCPPADAFLGELAMSGEVIALSLPVDYWDYLGWKDIYGSPDHSVRQRGYASLRGDRGVYTPQIVVNGHDHAVGSNKSDVKALIEEANLDGMKVDVSIETHGDQYVVTLPEMNEMDGDVVVWLAGYADLKTVEIKRGENAGNAIEYYNVVRSLKPLGAWEGDSKTFEVPKSSLVKDDITGCAVLVQIVKDGVPGPIIGADSVSLL